MAMRGPTEERLSPCVDQTEDDIAHYYRQAPIGAPAVIRSTQGGALVYDLQAIEGESNSRVYVTNTKGLGGASFYKKHGRNCWHPTGQTSLVVPTKAVLSWIEEHPSPLGASHVRTTRRAVTVLESPVVNGDREAVDEALRAALKAAKPD